MKNYFKQLGLWLLETIKVLLWKFIVQGLDKGANVIFAPLLNRVMNVEYKFGFYKDTLSEVFARNRPTCRLCKCLCRLFNYFEQDHCDKSIED